MLGERNGSEASPHVRLVHLHIPGGSDEWFHSMKLVKLQPFIVHLGSRVAFCTLTDATTLPTLNATEKLSNI